MQHPFDVESPYRGQLSDLVTQVEDVDARIRALQAERVRLLAAAHDLAEREGSRPVEAVPGSWEYELAAAEAKVAGRQQTSHSEACAESQQGSQPGSQAEPQPEPLQEPLPSRRSGLPRGAIARLERAHRLVRAELAAVLNVSEATIGNDIGHAIDTVQHCPALLATQADGLITEQHVRRIVDAGRIISQQVPVHQGSTLVDEAGVQLEEEAAQQEIARRYALFDQAMVPHAQAMTPNQLVPVAKRLAEKLAGARFDDRHRLAKQERRVWVTDVDDGMCHLTALLSSLEAHAIFDRLTQFGKLAQANDLANAKAAAGAAGSTTSATACAGSVPGSGPDGPVSPDSPVNTDGPSSDAGRVSAASLKRPLPEARADSLVALLLEGEVSPESASETYSASETNGANEANEANGSTGATGATGTTKKLGPRVTARVQVLIPVSLTGRLDDATPTGIGADTRTGAGKGACAGTGTGTGTENARGADTNAGLTSTKDDQYSPNGIDEGWFQPELVGVGPIDTETAALIAHDAPTWDNITVEDGVVSGPDTMGDILTVDGYRVPAKIRRRLAARDMRCRFVGCVLPVYRCDVDHTIAAEDGGPTATTNLSFICRGHHIMKHHGGLLVEQGDRGVLTWSLPSGRIYETKPPSKVTFITALASPDFQALMAENRLREPFGPESEGFGDPRGGTSQQSTSPDNTRYLDPFTSDPPGM